MRAGNPEPPLRYGYLDSTFSRTRNDMRFLQGWTLLLGFFSVLALHGAAKAQDVELLGKFHGTTPPDGYFERIARDPGAFQYQRALIRRGLNLREAPRIQTRGRALAPAFAPALAGMSTREPRRSPMTGAFRFPLILGLFSDSPEPADIYAREKVQAEFFDGPQGNPAAGGTIPEFYSEISGGRVTLAGTTFDWKRTPLTQSQVTAGESALGGEARIGEFIVEIIQALDDGSVDWGKFDNDGPDGIPNSGDDDGYVDVLAVMHSTPGGECPDPDRANRIWSHRWNLYQAARAETGSWVDAVRADVGYTTTTPAVLSAANPDFPFLRILDYTVQPVMDCAGTLPNTIGVFAHELGHGFGLPDLYGVDSGQNGIGNWGLMGTGSWGCDGDSPEFPCHMSAWSKLVLGWADVEILPAGTDLGTLALSPVETTGKIYRVDAGDGSGEYFLLENRQRVGFDRNLLQPGLLVWHVDPQYIADHWYGINSDGQHQGVWLRQADGRNDLNRVGGGRGDSGDPFPGAFQRRDLHAATDPGSWSHYGSAMGITLMDIQEAGSDITFQALTGYQPLTLRTQGTPGDVGLISVDSTTSQASEWIFNSAPFQSHTIQAAPGVETGGGYRVGFMEWSDGAPRIREYRTGLAGETFTATYGGTEVHLDISVTGPVAEISPGSIDFTPGDEEGWVQEGETVAVMAQPRTGFGFTGWTGALVGQPNPATLTADAPMEAGALFDLTFSAASNPATMEIEAATSYFLALQVGNANLPVRWTLTSGKLPEGMLLDPVGRIHGAALERGTFPLTFHVADGIGLEADASLDLVVMDPVISFERLASAFLLSGAALDFNQKTFLDRSGNVNGVYDLGDFRAFFLRNPDLPATGDLQEGIELLVPMGDLRALNGEKEVIR